MPTFLPSSCHRRRSSSVVALVLALIGAAVRPIHLRLRCGPGHAPGGRRRHSDSRGDQPSDLRAGRRGRLPGASGGPSVLSARSGCCGSTRRSRASYHPRRAPDRRGERAHPAPSRLRIVVLGGFKSCLERSPHADCGSYARQRDSPGWRRPVCHGRGRERRLRSRPAAPVAYIAGYDDYPAMFAAAAAAGALGGPLLLTRPDTLWTAVTATELARLRPARIVLAGADATRFLMTVLSTPADVSRRACRARRASIAYATAAAIARGAYPERRRSRVHRQRREHRRWSDGRCRGRKAPPALAPDRHRIGVGPDASRARPTGAPCPGDPRSRERRLERGRDDVRSGDHCAHADAHALARRKRRLRRPRRRRVRLLRRRPRPRRRRRRRPHPRRLPTPTPTAHADADSPTPTPPADPDAHSLADSDSHAAHGGGRRDRPAV